MKGCVVFHFFLSLEICSDFSLAVIVPLLPISDFKAINCERTDEVGDPISNSDDSNDKFQLKKNRFSSTSVEFAICIVKII